MMSKLLGVVALAGVLAGCVTREIPQVTFDGRELDLMPVTLSAGPINKIFDGRQRPLEQTKRGWCCTLDLASPGELAIDYPNAAPADLTVRPLSRSAEGKVVGGKFVMPLVKPGHFVVNSPSGAGEDIHVFVNAPFVEPPVQGKVTRFARGEHRPGVVAPESGETVILEEGAVVHAEVFLLNVTNVTICGRGVFDFSEWERADPRAQAFRAAHGLPKEDTEFACNPFTVYGSSHIRIEGVTLKDAPFWTLLIRNGSSDVEIDNLKIVGNWRYNSDGINVQASSFVRIHDSFLRTFDDCLVARAAYMDGEDGLPTKDILCEHNVLWCDWGKNCEVWAGHKETVIENVTYRRNVFANVHFLGCDVTTWFCSPSTVIRNILFEDNEFDVVQPRWKTVFQSRDHEPFNLERETELALLSVDAWKPAENLGNQHFGPAKDESLYRLTYDGIRFARPRIFGDGFKRLTVKSETSTPYQQIRNLVVEGLPEGTEVIEKGNTKFTHVR